MSKSLKAIGINSGEALDKFATLEKQSKKVQSTFNNMGRSIGSLKQKLDLLKAEREWIPASNLRAIKAYTREIQNLEKQIDRLENKGRGGFFSRMFGGIGGGRSGGGMGGMLMGLGRAALPLAGASLLTAGLGNTISAGMDASRNRASFETLAGKEQGGKLFTDIKKFAEDSIYGNELYDNALQMKAFGVATEKVLPNMKMLGDVAMGNKEKLQSLSLAYSQIQSAQKLQGQDLLQLVNAGFNPLTIIAEKTGMKYADLRKKMEDGAITADMVTAAFKVATSEGGQFYNMTQKIAETPFGKWEAFKGQLQGIATDIGIKLLPAISAVIDVFGRATQKVYELGSTIYNNLQPVFTALEPVVQLVGDSLGRIFEVVGDIVGSVTQILGPVLSKLIEILKGPLKAALWIIEKALQAVAWVADKVAWVFGKIGDAASWVANKVTGAFNWIGDKVSGIFGGSIVSDLADKARSAGSAAANGIVSAFKAANITEQITAETLKSFQSMFHFIYGLDAVTILRNKDVVPENPFSKFGLAKNSGSSSRSKSNDAVATGGTKNTVVHINIGKQIETLTVMAGNVKESAQKIGDTIVDEVNRALAMGLSIAE